ncbi:DarT ssDNA thymidine ADP-ribosyltransferase family protein [Aliarcobacter butzleri]|uniref:type II toxin-antitoxin system toxin DNA ADP-ribosyl transferase DarT n=1 Tax=Aliarcobacter butzleri TaxID=28197 RepID=UPI003AF79D4A
MYYIDVNTLDVVQMSLDFNISKEYITSCIEDYNIKNGYKKVNDYKQKELILNSIPENLRSKYFYHFTHIENLESILKNGFLSTNKKDALGLGHKNIANESIQHRRHEMDVTCFPHGKVHDYVPFYLTTTNPMLLSLVNNKNIDQPLMIFFTIPIHKILENKVVFTDASANTSTPPNFYNTPSDLEKLDWNAIEKKAWGSVNNDEKHKRMAEVLVYEEVPLDWIESVIVWNQSIKDYVIKTFKENSTHIPRVIFESYGNNFYFTKFALGRKNETLVTGPSFLKMFFENAIKEIIESRVSRTSFKFQNIKDGIEAVEKDFCCITELSDIYELKTSNKTHSDNVSDHTKKVVSNLTQNSYFSGLSDIDKNIVKLSAYLHDIGKGPKSKWKDEIQPSYPDHPADAIPMLKRILVEDFKELTEYEIRKICLIVVYHDLIGDIIGNNRSQKELIDLINDENELNMLIAISMADVSAINVVWNIALQFNLPTLIQEVKEAKIV